MPIQAPQWTEFLSCPICCHEFDGGQRGPISLGCGHTVCRGCLAKLQRNQCPYDQTVMRLELDQLPVNGALLSLVNGNSGASNGALSASELGDQSSPQHPPPAVPQRHGPQYFSAIQCIKELALLLKPFSGATANGTTSLLSRPMQRKLVTLINCQLVEEEGRARAVRAARSLGERTVTELILHHQNHNLLSANLWAAVRSRGCQFLGPAMQEDVLKLVLLALEDGSPLSRKVLVMFVVQRLEPHFPQASKTSIGHVVQLLYRASCFKVSKREGDSSLMQLKEEFRTYEALRREHDAQIVQIATEAGLRIAPDQWSSLLYGDTAHKSHMQSIIDKLQTPQSFGQSVQELVIALQRTGDPGQLSSLRPQLELLAGLDPSPDAQVPGWELCTSAMEAVKGVVTGLVQFIQHHGNRKITDAHHALNAKYKTSMCRDLTQRGGCPRGNDCTFAHSDDELERYRSRNRKHGKNLASASQIGQGANQSSSSLNLIQNHVNANLQQDHGASLPKPPLHSPDNPKPMQQPPPLSKVQHQTLPSLQKQQQHQSPLSPNPALQQILSNDVVIPMLKNGERPPSIPVIGKPMLVEELLPPGISSTHASFEAAKFMQVSPHTQGIPIIPAAGGTANVIRPALPSQTPVFATPIAAEYQPHHTFFPPQAQIFAQPPTAPQAPPPSITVANASPAQAPPVAAAAALHHAVPPQPLYSPQHPPPIMTPDLFSHSPHHLVVNQVYNIIGPRDLSGPIADTRQISSLSKSVVSSWPNVSQEEQKQQSTLDLCLQSSPNNENLFESSEQIASKSLTELRERMRVILSQLESVVGKEATDEVAIKVANGEIVSTAVDLLPEYSSTYSIWTTGANVDFWGKASEKPFDPSLGYRTNVQKSLKAKEDLIPFDPPVVSRFGPISKVTLPRPFIRPSNPIQVSACSTTDPITTPTVHRPVPAISPMPQVVYQPPGFVGLVSYAPSLELMNTVGHGIIDPSHLHMSQIDVTGHRPTDPVFDFVQMGQEERQRQQLIAAKEGIDGFSLQQKLEEMRLKDELNHVVQGIQEKRKEMEDGSQDEDFDFENWKFDFDEGDKD